MGQIVCIAIFPSSTLVCRVSGKHKNVLSVPWHAGILFWYKEGVMPKKKVIATQRLHGTLSDWTKFTTQNKEKQKKK
jgi:hypothetical protein